MEWKQGLRLRDDVGVEGSQVLSEEYHSSSILMVDSEKASLEEGSFAVMGVAIEVADALVADRLKNDMVK